MEIRIRRADGTVSFPTPSDGSKIIKVLLTTDGTLKRFLVFLYRGERRFLLGEYETNLLTEDISPPDRYEDFFPAKCFNPVDNTENEFFRKRGNLTLILW